MPRARELRLVVEDAAEVLAVREDLVLHRQEGAAGVDQVEARQPVLERDLLGAEVLLDGHRVVGAALDRRVVGDDHALDALDQRRCRSRCRPPAPRPRTGPRPPARRAPGRRCPGRSGGRRARGPAACRARGGARSSVRRRRRRARRRLGFASRRSSTCARMAPALAAKARSGRGRGGAQDGHQVRRLWPRRTRPCARGARPGSPAGRAG